MINSEKTKGSEVSEFFFSLKIVSSLRILLCEMLQRTPIHYTPNDDRGLVHMTGSGTGRGSHAVWTIYFFFIYPVFSTGITGCFIMDIAT